MGSMCATANWTDVYPTRFWWGKRILTVLFVLLGGIFLAHRILVHRAERQFLAEVEVIRSRHQPVEVADLESAAIPDSSNIVTLLDQAANAIVSGGSQQYEALTAFSNETAGATDFAVLRGWVRANAPALAAARQARRRQRVDWHLHLASPVAATPLYRIRQNQAPLVRLLEQASTDAALHGDGVAADEYARDILTIADAIDHQPFPISHNWATEFSNIAATCIERAGPILGANLRSGRPSDRAATDDLLAELLNEAPCRERFRRSLAGARVMVMDTARTIDSGTFTRAMLIHVSPTDAVQFFLLRPMIVAADTEHLRGATAAFEASDAPDYPSMMARCRPEIGFYPGVASVERRIGWTGSRSWMAPASVFLIRDHFEAIALRRLAAIDLAMRLYQADHAGNLPAALNDLVPGYLPSLPSDPFDRSGRPIRLKLNSPARIYSIGPDGKDNGGDDTPPASGGDPADIVLRLEHVRWPTPTGEPPELPAATTSPAR